MVANFEGGGRVGTMNEKPKTLLEQAEIEQSRAEEVMRAAEGASERDSYWENKNEAILEVLHSEAEKAYAREVDRDHSEAIQEDVKRRGRFRRSDEKIGKLVRSMHIDRQIDGRSEDPNKRGALEIKGFQYGRYYCISPEMTVIQVSDESMEQCDVCFGRIKDLVDTGVFSDAHPERALVQSGDKVYVTLEPLAKDETIEALVERVLKWNVEANHLRFGL